MRPLSWSRYVETRKLFCEENETIEQILSRVF